MPSIKLLFSFYLTKVYVELFFVVKQSLLCLCLLLQKKGPLLISLANEFVRALYMALLALTVSLDSSFGLRKSTVWKKHVEK
jgi:hypothetical protein